MIAIDLQTNDKALTAIMKGQDRQMLYAMIAAVKKTSTWLSRKISTAIVREALIPKKALKPRIFHEVDSKTLTGKIWVGLNPISPQKVGKLSQVSGGAKAGKHFFPGAFIASANNSPDLIWRREGKARFPIKREFIEIDEPGLEIMRRFERQAQQYFYKRLQEEINYRLNVKK